MREHRSTQSCRQINRRRRLPAHAGERSPEPSAWTLLEPDCSVDQHSTRPTPVGRCLDLRLLGSYRTRQHRCRRLACPFRNRQSS
eukprot:2990001-Prymnesium_polylepis.5